MRMDWGGRRARKMEEEKEFKRFFGRREALDGN
jgi:hypothetical protein